MSQIYLYNQQEPANPFDLKRENLSLETMAHSLSQLNRYTGHACFPYSVAQHSLLLWCVVPEYLKKCALIHDWSEAFTNDVAYPVKIFLPEYKRVEGGIQKRIFDLMGVDFQLMDELHDYDRRICGDEMDVLFPNHTNIIKTERLGVHIRETPWRSMKTSYLNALLREFE